MISLETFSRTLVIGLPSFEVRSGLAFVGTHNSGFRSMVRR